MGIRIAGVGSLTIDGRQIAVKANLTVSPDPVERDGISGQDRVHDYKEMPRVPYIEADFSMQPDFAMEDLPPMTNSTVVAQMADGRIFVLRQSWYKAPADINSQEGQYRARFEGVACDEVQ